MLASPMDALPKTWLYVYSAWQFTSLVTFNATALYEECQSEAVDCIGEYPHSNECEQEEVSVGKIENLQYVSVCLKIELREKLGRRLPVPHIP